MSARAAVMARMMIEGLSPNASQSDVERFVLNHFAQDMVSDFSLAVNIAGEIEDLKEIDAIVEGRQP